MLPKKLSTIEKKGLLELKQKLFEALPNQIDFVRLYGSKARGNAGKYSDIDLLMVVKRKDKRIRDKITDIEVKNMEKYGLPLSTFVMSRREYDEQLKIPTLFIQFAEKEGVNL